MFQAGFDLSDTDPGSFNGTGVASNLSAATVEVMGVVYSKECYAIAIAAALTLLAGIYQVMNRSVKCLISSHLIFVRLSGVGSRGEQLKQGAPDFPFPGHIDQL